MSGDGGKTGLDDDNDRRGRVDLLAMMPRAS
jgi:hypothetical protein